MFIALSFARYCRYRLCVPSSSHAVVVRQVASFFMQHRCLCALSYSRTVVSVRRCFLRTVVSVRRCSHAPSFSCAVVLAHLRFSCAVVVFAHCRFLFFFSVSAPLFLRQSAPFASSFASRFFYFFFSVGACLRSSAPTATGSPSLSSLSYHFYENSKGSTIQSLGEGVKESPPPLSACCLRCLFAFVCALRLLLEPL
ncbi:hypothetical protein QJS10_CPB19g01709 [Acorus calamus]|uniref:Transmembrane protein n=1 Tax=Acorus calamus TaxID=4465 RepID=A0AAV9CG74_ACOCL|nr:hypothetical protein QJS10_CPB19g01709 [Acorus calamus]